MKKYYIFFIVMIVSCSVLFAQTDKSVAWDTGEKELFLGLEPVV
jgi:hypothetical protein